MWQCSTLSYTSCRKFNVSRHEKLKHKVKTLDHKNINEKRAIEPFEVYSRGLHCGSWVPCLCPQKNKFVQITDLNKINPSPVSINVYIDRDIWCLKIHILVLLLETQKLN